MNTTEHLLECLNEELLEIQDALDSGTVDMDAKNKEIEHEINDFIAVYQMLAERNILKPLEIIFKKPVSVEIDTYKELASSCRAMQYYLFKSNRFGLDDIHPRLKETNKALIEKQANIFVSVIKFNMIQFRLWEDHELQAKKDRVLKWMEYSKVKGLIIEKKIKSSDNDIETILDHSENIYNILMHSKCVSTVDDPFRNNKGLHESLTELIDSLDMSLENKHYDSINEANIQVSILIDEKNRFVKAWDEAKKEMDSLTKLSRWLMGYVMELHSFRNNLFKNKDYESMKSSVRDNFPQLLGFNQQQLFKKLGISAKENQDAIKRAVKYIDTKHGDKEDE